MRRICLAASRIVRESLRTRPVAAWLLLAAALAPPAAVAAGPAAIANPDFTDADGDGTPDHWSLETWVLEDYRGVRCLSMKVPRKDKSAFTGRATTSFAGPAGFYRVTVRYLDEKDGVSKLKLLVNDRVVHIWNFDGTFGDCWREEVIDNVELAPGDTLALWGRDNPTEYCRIRGIDVVPSPRPPTGRELDALRSPPEIVPAVDGPLVPLADHRDLTADERRPESRPLILGGPILVHAEPGMPPHLRLELNQPRQPTWSWSFHGSEGRPVAKPEAVVEQQPVSYAIDTLVSDFRPPVTAAGLYEIRGPQGWWSADMPHVLAVSSGPDDRTVATATGLFYLFVPRGTRSFAVGAFCNGGYIGEVTIRGPDGRLVTCMDVPPDDPHGVAVRVGPGEDDRVWSVRIVGVAPRLRVVGVPPYLATHPRHLLVPRPSLEQPTPDGGRDR